MLAARSTSTWTCRSASCCCLYITSDQFACWCFFHHQPNWFFHSNLL